VSRGDVHSRVLNVFAQVILVLQHCSLGVTKSIRPVKKLSDEVVASAAWLSVWSEMEVIWIWSN